MLFAESNTVQWSLDIIISMYDIGVVFELDFVNYCLSPRTIQNEIPYPTIGEERYLSEFSNVTNV